MDPILYVMLLDMSVGHSTQFYIMQSCLNERAVHDFSRRWLNMGLNMQPLTALAYA